MTSTQSILQFKRALRIQLVNIEPGLSEHQLHSLKLACFLLDIPRQQLENADTFIDLYQLIEHKIPQHAPSLIYQMLILVGFPKPLLQSLQPFVNMEIDLEQNQLMDLTLTLSFILGEISEKKYRKFKELARLTFLPEYHTSKILSRSHLLELLQDRNVLIPNQLVYMFGWLEAAGCPLQVEYLQEFCVRQSLTVPDWTELQLPELDDDFESDTIEINSAKIDKFILEIISKKRCLFCTVKCTICSILLVVLPLLLTFLSISGFVVFYNSSQRTSLHSVHNIGSNTSVIIDPNCYNTLWIKEVTLCNVKGYENNPAKITLYKTSKGALDYITKQPKQVTFKYNPIYINLRISFNILNGNAPIYSAGNSTLTYTFSFRADVNFTVCPLELHIFDNYENYNHYLYSTERQNSPTSSKDCTISSVNTTLQEHIVVYHLYPNTFYYFAIGLTRHLYVNVTITGKLEEYDISDLTSEKCVLSSNVTSCTVPVADSTISDVQDYICLLARSSNNNKGSITVDVTPAKWNIGSVTCLLFSTITTFFTACIIISIVLFIIRHDRKESAVISRYTDLLTD